MKTITTDKMTIGLVEVPDDAKNMCLEQNILFDLVAGDRFDIIASTEFFD